VVVDGQDAEAVHAVVAEAVERARRGDGPSLIEAKTYRFGEHAEGLIIPVAYRDEAEVERWKQRDPVAILRDRLIADGVLDAAAAAAIEAELGEQVAAAVAFAKQSPSPEPEAAFEDVYSNPIAGGAR